MPSAALLAPPACGLRIGLFGGSFNPPHAGHLAVAREALRRLDLDRVWWLVSPQNPLKDPSETDDFASRLAATATLARGHRFEVVRLERDIGSRTTAETLAALAPVLARGRFVWIMGADSFAGLDRWNDWQRIPETLPLAVFARPGSTLRALRSNAARRYADCRIDASRAPLLADLSPPAWVFLPMRLRPESSSSIRSRRHP